MLAKRNAFTLIELLIVVAIIAILAAIAVPNFLEAQVRSKISRAKNDMRVLATALEAYHVDQQAYPEIIPRVEDLESGGAWLMRPLTTPVAYISSLPDDPFLPARPEPVIGPRRSFRYTGYPISPDPAQIWSLASNGPDLWIDTPGPYMGYSAKLFYGGDPAMPDLGAWVLYDPTNGSTSKGDIFRGSDYMP